MTQSGCRDDPGLTLQPGSASSNRAGRRADPRLTLFLREVIAELGR